MSPALKFRRQESALHSVQVAGLLLEVKLKLDQRPGRNRIMIHHARESDLGTRTKAVYVNKFWAILWVAWASSAFGQTNITFTNKSGEVISNAVVVRWTLSMLYYETAAGGGGVKLADLPVFLQKRFDYSETNAALEQRVVALKNRLAALRAVDELQAAKDAAQAKAWRAKLDKTKVGIAGKVVQKIADGLLINSGADFSYNTAWWAMPDGTPGACGICLLVGYSGAVDGEGVLVEAYPNGTYQYTTVMGAAKTVRRYEFDPAAVLTPATPEEMSKITNRFTINKY